MTPKEKAIEMVNQYEDHLFNRFTQDEDWVKCTQSALIAVNQTIKTLDLVSDSYWQPALLHFWKNVKREIKKL